MVNIDTHLLAAEIKSLIDSGKLPVAVQNEAHAL